MSAVYRSILLACGGALAVVIVCRWLFLGAQPSSQPVILFQWQDYMDPPFLADYERRYKQKPAITIFADEDEAFAKMRAGFKPDVMGPCYYELPRWEEAGLLQPIDTSKLSNWHKISPTLRNLPGISAGPSKVWFVPHYWGNTSLTIRTDLAPEYARSQSWNILFDPKYKGRVSVLDGVDDTVPFIAKMIGINAYAMSDQDWAKVQAKLRALMANVRFVSSDDTSLAQGLASGELVAAMSWRSTFAALRREHKPVAFLDPPGGMFTYVCGLVMHKDPSNEQKALALIDSSLSDGAAVYMVEHIGDEPANTQAMKQVPSWVYASLNIPTDLESFLKEGSFQQRFKDKEKILNAWSNIKSGIQ